MIIVFIQGGGRSCGGKMPKFCPKQADFEWKYRICEKCGESIYRKIGIGELFWKNKVENSKKHKKK